MVYFSPCRLMCRCTFVLFIEISICFLINPSVSPGHVLRKPSFISLRRLVVVGRILRHGNTMPILVWLYGP